MARLGVVDVELEPEEPPAVVDAVARLLATERPDPDPWWQAGLDENLLQS